MAVFFTKPARKAGFHNIERTQSKFSSAYQIHAAEMGGLLTADQALEEYKKLVGFKRPKTAAKSKKSA